MESKKQKIIGIIVQTHRTPIEQADDILSLFGVMPRIVLTQDWYESEEEKNGWLGYVWNEPKGYELEEIINQDKFYNPTQAIFKYME